MPPEPKCMKCDNPATHKITKIVKGKIHDLLLCDEHAAMFSPYVKQGAPVHLVELLHQILKQQEQRIVDKGPVCPNCGISYHAYRKTLLLGCSDCYDAFGNLLLNDIRKIHGVVSHHPEAAGESVEPDMFPDVAGELAGKAPAEDREEGGAAVKPPDPRLSVEELQKKMAEAVQQEDFEKAARLRDTIRMFKSLEPPQPQRCEKCNSPMRILHGTRGFFLACSNYPECRFTRPVETPPGEEDPLAPPDEPEE